MANWQIVTIFGGLPIFADVTYWCGDGWTTDDDAEVNDLRWIKQRKGKAPEPGAPLSQKIWDKLEKETWWEASVIEQHTEACIADSDEKRERRFDMAPFPKNATIPAEQIA